MCDFPEKYINLKNWAYVLNVCSECPRVFIIDAEMNNKDDVDIALILFHHYKM